MAMSGSGWLGAAEVVRAVRLGEMSAEEATEQAIARIERDDAVVNAVVVRDFERARRRAVEVDGLVAAGVGLTLAGLPMTVKESIDVAGLATSWGLAPFADHVAARDAAVVRRLKAAGAIIVGKTNPAAGLGDCQTRNQVYGTTNNPLRSVVSAGGSSGGSAAALAAGLVSAEMGSDLGGSVRIPAAFCGVWGLKPTNDLVSTRGHFFPTTDGAAVPCGVVGPMARSSEDLELLLAVVAEHPLALDALPSRLRVGVLLDGPPWRAVSWRRCRRWRVGLRASVIIWTATQSCRRRRLIYPSTWRCSTQPRLVGATARRAWRAGSTCWTRRHGRRVPGTMRSTPTTWCLRRCSPLLLSRRTRLICPAGSWTWTGRRWLVIPSWCGGVSAPIRGILLCVFLRGKTLPGCR